MKCNAPPLEANAYDPVVVKEQINEAILHQLFNDEICVLRIPNYCSLEALMAIEKFIQESQGKLMRSYYVGYKDQKPIRKFYGINLLGTPYNSTYHCEPSHPSFQQYFEDALPNLHALRAAVAPYLSPIDKLRLQLDEHWPYGAGIATFHPGKNMFVGVCRVMYAEESVLGETQPHIDSLPSHIQHLNKQYSANLYVHVPEVGGELEIWDVPPLKAEEVLMVDMEGDWRSHLPEPLVIKPKRGELILFNTRRPHTVRSFPSGTRSSIQCFIGMYKDYTLECWS